MLASGSSVLTVKPHFDGIFAEWIRTGDDKHPRGSIISIPTDDILKTTVFLTVMGGKDTYREVDFP